MHIPEKYYERIPQFYFIVGVLLLANSIYLGMENFAAYLYLAFGCVSILYAVGVKRARQRNRNYPLTEMQPTEAEPEAEATPEAAPESEARELS